MGFYCLLWSVSSSWHLVERSGFNLWPGPYYVVFLAETICSRDRLTGVKTQLLQLCSWFHFAVSNSLKRGEPLLMNSCRNNSTVFGMYGYNLFSSRYNLHFVFMDKSPHSWVQSWEFWKLLGFDHLWLESTLQVYLVNSCLIQMSLSRVNDHRRQGKYSDTKQWIAKQNIHKFER